ncbi:MAG: class I SAM-dependent methyltransferase [Bauldia sp.]|nr:MAG: class I SAM-dependent methyltransferase [Bauldia sp.]MBE0692218.1 class I SAM-dependent methyltransferase [Aquamicrobium sp.]
MHNRYARLAARVYDLDKPVGRSFGDIEYYRQRLEGCGGPVLEPAVGNGRIFVPLLEAGFEMEGFDASEEMLGYCREECRRRGLAAGLSRRTFEDFAYDRRFAAIILPLGSFQLVTDTPTAMAVLARFRDHLRPGGRLILDIDPIGAFLGPSGSIRSWTTPEGELLTLTDDRVETDHVAQTTLSHLRYERWRDGRLVETELDLFRLRWWGVTELSLALQAAGFGEVVASGDYIHGRAPRQGDGIVTVEAVRG